MTTPENPSPGKTFVFVVDDDASVRKGLKRLLQLAGYAVETFASATEFLAHSPAERPACLLLDVRLPDMDGLELQELLASEKDDLPVVFMTGHGDIPMSVRAMKAGAVDFITKPLMKESLLPAIETALAKSREVLLQGSRLNFVKQRLATLTQREKDVLALVVLGRLNKQIAAELGISEKTVKFFRGRVMHKLEANSVPDLVRMTMDLHFE